MTPDVSVLTFRDLEYIVAIAEYKSFSIAAKHCAVSQPALSGQIKKVEQALDVQIFERTNREVLVTEAGLKIVRQSESILEELEILGEIARNTDGMLQGTLRLGIISSLANFYLPKILPKIKKEFPDLEIIVRSAIEVQLLEDLRLGKIDVVICSLPLPKNAGVFNNQSIFMEELYLVSNNNNPIIEKNKVKLKNLNPNEMIFIDEHNELTKQILELINTYEIEFPVQPTYTSSVEMLIEMLKVSPKYSILPKLAFDSIKNKKKLSRVNLEGSKLKREISLVWRPRYRANKGIEKLADKLVSFSA